MRNNKNFIFIIIALFFYSFMLVIFGVLSRQMIEKSIYIVSVKQIEILEKNLSYFIDNKSISNIEDDIVGIVKIIRNHNFPQINNIKIYSEAKRIVYTYGNKQIIHEDFDINKTTEKKFFYSIVKSENKNERFFKTVFYITKNNKIYGYFEISYNFFTLKDILFKERISIFLIVLIISSLILLFLIIMILNLQVRLFRKDNQLVKLSNIDELTTLDNKDFFIKLLKKEIERIERMSGKLTLIIFDIDNFFEINEKYGFEFGDLVLSTISNIILSNIRNFDIIGRFGDDEIAVCMINADEEDGNNAAERFKTAIEENKFYVEGKDELTISISIGISSINIQEKNNEAELNNSIYNRLLFNSLNALSFAKRNGKNRIVRYSSIPKK